jgi:hypothetical protein
MRSAPRAANSTTPHQRSATEYPDADVVGAGGKVAVEQAEHSERG